MNKAKLNTGIGGGTATTVKNKAEFENARQRAIELLWNMDCEDVIRSVLFVLGDYAVTEIESKEEARERANYIVNILYHVASTTTKEALLYVYSFVKGATEAYEAKQEREV